MKIEQIIDEMQASLTKLRGRLRDRGKGECICLGPKQMFRHHDCPLHGWIATYKKGEEECRRLRGETSGVTDFHRGTPDLPLHARVAKALEERVWQEGATGNWFMGDRRGTWENHLVPDYPNDLVAAMAALEEYFSQEKPRPVITYMADDGYAPYRWIIELDGVEPIVLTSLPQAICEAIVAHAEGK